MGAQFKQNAARNVKPIEVYSSPHRLGYSESTGFDLPCLTP
jgi:hypothetical protein